MLNIRSLFKQEHRIPLRGAPRVELLEIIADAVRVHDGCLCLNKPVCVFADDIFGEIPVIVRQLRANSEDVDFARDFDIGDGYTTEHLDNSQLRLIVEAL